MGGPGSTSFASVKITGRSLADIQTVTQQVFSENGYVGGAVGSSRMVFEKEGSAANTLAREGFMATQAGARTLLRVRVNIDNWGNDTFHLECEVFMVTGASDSFFAEEQRLANVRTTPYKSLLNEVAKRLKQS
jgi:hypothetical protein